MLTPVRALTVMRVGFFVTCLVDLMRPSIGFAAIKLLEAGGAEVFVPPRQTCCGQPAYNSGDRADAIALARKVVAEFEGCDYLVAPSGSCSGMIRTHYADLFADDPPMQARAEALAAKTCELTDFLVNVLKLDARARALRRHDHLPRLLRRPARDGRQDAAARAARQGPRRSSCAEMAESETCCGFGGTFSIKFGEISARLADNKCQHIADSRRRRGGARRPRLHAEHRGPAAPARRHEDEGAARRRGAGGRRPAQGAHRREPAGLSDASRVDALQGDARTSS